MLALTVKILSGGLAILLVLIGLSWWQPVTASRILWPLVEWGMLNEEFTGITTDGSVREGLYQIAPTGISTAPVVEAARHFLNSLSAEQKARTQYPVDDLEWRRWANIHLSTRQGAGLLEMNADQHAAALDLLRASLSARGFQTSNNIMKLEGHLADLLDDHESYGEKRYWFTVMGEPSLSEPWGWQIDGHHLVINYFVLGDQVVMTPTFMGSEPPSTETGRFAGVSILEPELEAGLVLINGLTREQQRLAILASQKQGNNNRGELWQDNAVVPFEGIALHQIAQEQQAAANKLIRLYIDNMADGHAEVKMQEILQHWDSTYFAWVGDTQADSVFYYRIHSPVLMIEYDHQLPIALSGPKAPTREHVRTAVRTPNGNDYGKDLLGMHLRQHAH